MATPPTPATIIGGPVSPYVRKVLAACEMKGVPYQVDPIVPFFGDDRFSELNPLRRIPVYIDDQVSISDSTVICEYLDERYPTPASPAQDTSRAGPGALDRGVRRHAHGRRLHLAHLLRGRGRTRPFGSGRATRTRSPARWPRSCRR